MGLNCSGDEFCRRSDAALEGATGVLKLVDDILVYADSIEQLKTRLNDVLQRCEENGITISKKKIEIGTKVTFAGFDVSAEGNSPTPDRIEAIKNFPTPKNITGVRGFHGLTQGFNDYAHELSLIDKPIRDCLSTKNAFHCTLLAFSLNFPVPKNLLNEVGIKQKVLLVIFAKIQLFISHF